MINKEMLEKVNNGILTADAINGQTTEDDAKIEEVIRIFSQVKTLLKEQPPASEFTKECRKHICISQMEGYVPYPVAKRLVYTICDRLDASEASRKELLTACETAGKMIAKCSKVFLGTGDTPEPEDMANAICDIKAAIKANK